MNYDEVGRILQKALDGFVIDTESVKAIAENVKDQLLINIPEDENLLNCINERGVNHGVMQFYYNLLIKIAEYEKEQIKKKVSA